MGWNHLKENRFKGSAQRLGGLTTTGELSDEGGNAEAVVHGGGAGGSSSQAKGYGLREIGRMVERLQARGEQRVDPRAVAGVGDGLALVPCPAVGAHREEICAGLERDGR